MPQAHPALEGQVKGDLAHQGEDAHPHQVTLLVFGMSVALRDAEGEQGHGQPPDHPHPQCAREKHVSHMVKDHTDHGDQLQARSVQDPQFLQLLHILRSSLPVICRMAPA